MGDGEHMNQTHLLLCMLALVALGGVGAWLVFSDYDGTNTGAAALRDGHSTPDAAWETLEDTDPASHVGGPGPESTAPLEMHDPEQVDTDPGSDSTPPRRDEPFSRDNSSPDSPTPQQPADRPSGKTDEQPQPRRLTRAEQEEQRRIERGRPALQRRLARTPGSVSHSGELAKSPQQEKWEEEWHAEGFTPPEMIPTPVQGKIMSEDAREGLAKATVGLISFFPLDGVAGGPLLPVITEFETDDNGVFSGDIPASKLPPLNYPAVAIAVSWQGHRIITAAPLATLEVGKQNEFGIIWAPQTPFVLKADATQFSGELRVVSTGELDPQRWHSARRAQAFAWFPAFNVAKSDPEEGQSGPDEGHAEVIGTWDNWNTPYVSLLGGELLQTRRPLRASTVSNRLTGVPPLPFETLVFENDGFTPISGQVVNSDGYALANAAVTTVGGDLTQTVVTDAGGWFTFTDPPEKTTALHCVHDSYVETRLTPVQPGDSSVTIVLTTPRPRIHLFVTDKYTQIPIADIGVKVIGLWAWGKNRGKPMPEAFVNLTSTDGHFVLEWEFALKSITLERIGYFPKHFENPAALQEAGDGRIEVSLAPGRNLEVRPRDYTNVQDSSRWFPDAKEGPGIYTAWSHHWIEWDIDFGEEVEEGEQGGRFDILLGCTNRGIVDNDYEFKVDVYVDGEKKGTLTILADSLNVRSARMSLGELSGVHTIRLIWTNDKWIPQQLDANIRYASLQFLEQP
jgi:hypothetical protein